MDGVRDMFTDCAQRLGENFTNNLPMILVLIAVFVIFIVLSVVVINAITEADRRLTQDLSMKLADLRASINSNGAGRGAPAGAAPASVTTTHKDIANYFKSRSMKLGKSHELPKDCDSVVYVYKPECPACVYTFEEWSYFDAIFPYAVPVARMPRYRIDLTEHPDMDMALFSGVALPAIGIVPGGAIESIIMFPDNASDKDAWISLVRAYVVSRSRAGGAPPTEAKAIPAASPAETEKPVLTPVPEEESEEAVTAVAAAAPPLPPPPPSSDGTTNDSSDFPIDIVLGSGATVRVK